MEKRYRVEAQLDGDLAELYEGVMEAFERAGTTPLGEMNQTLLQTGLLLHMTMMSSFGLLGDDESQRLQQVAQRVAGEHLMWDITKLARQHWSGSGGSVDLQA